MDKRILICFFLLVAISQAKQLYMATVFRHGARYPLNNMYDGKQTAAFHGQLTAVGLRQQFLLGSYIQADYQNKTQLLNPTLKTREVQFFSVFDFERCIESAYGHALGLFSLANGQKIDENFDPALLEPPFETFLPRNLKSEEAPSNYALQLGFQPVPIRNGQQFFPICENKISIFIKRYEKCLPLFLQLQAQQALFTQQMRSLFNLTIQESNIQGLTDLYDTLVADNYLGRPLPSKLTTEDYEKLRFIERYLFTLVFEEQPARIFNAPFVTALIANMENLIKGNLGVKKLSAYSVHDSNIVPLLVYFNLTTAECLKKQFNSETVIGNCAVPVPFASSIFFELHQDDQKTSQYFVKVRYNGQYYNLCGKNSTQCDFNEFAQRSKAHLMNFSKECAKDKGQKDEQPVSE